jgi:hypothetical protein
LSVLPGLELDIPVLRNWRLRPYAQVAMGVGIRLFFGLPYR